MRRIRRWIEWLAAAAFLAAALPAAPVTAATMTQGALIRGAVVALQGTPHLWVADEQGVLHWSGDTRALAQRFVDWSARSEVTLAQLRNLRRGDPWLSAGLLKLGDPIYFVKWEATEPRPTLLHIGSITDVELFGIDTNNYGALVLEQAAWERQYGFPAASLTKGELAPATGSIIGSRESPVPKGTAADMEDGWRIAVSSATPDATAAVRATNRFNDPPVGGRQFFIGTVSVTRTGAPPARFNRASLYAVGPSNVGYTTFTDSCGVIPNELPSNELFSGGTISGNVCWSVSTSDAGSLLMYRTAGFGSDGQRIYFALR
jgi:hypothetical protein